VEADVRYYSRRACEEMGAARRAVTQAARERRLQLVDLYLQRLEALEAPSPFTDGQFTRALEPASGLPGRSAFDWSGAATSQRV
jgi:hypothetical protein